MFCDPLDFQQFTTVIKSLNPTGPTIIVSAPSNGGKFPQLSHNVRSPGCFMPLSLKLVCRPAGRRSTVITLLAQSLASAVAQGNVVRAICISKGKAHF
jgi:hypothetical protein